MAGIYNRDNIQYASMLEAMLNRRERELRDEQERQRRTAQHIVNGLKMFGRTAAMAYGGGFGSAADELSALEAEKAALVEAEQSKAALEAADYTKAVPDDYSSIVGSPSYGRTGYAPTYGREANQPEWINDYRIAMNKLLGGR